MHYGSQAEKQLSNSWHKLLLKVHTYIGGQGSLFLVKIDVGK